MDKKKEIKRLHELIDFTEEMALLFHEDSLDPKIVSSGLKKMAKILNCQEVKILRAEELKKKKSSVKENPSVAEAPIIIDEKLYGKIQAIHRKNNIFSSTDEYFLQVMAHQISNLIKFMKMAEERNQQLLHICEALAEAISKKDKYTGGHTLRVGHFARMIAEEMKLSTKVLDELNLAGILHDVGKIGIADDILKKKSALLTEEFEVMKTHPHLGYEILKHIKGLEGVIDGMRYHHERPDGLGYPYGLKGDKIPLVARIISVADTFDAMISNRPYRKGMPVQEALKEIKKYSGTQFDKEVVKAFEKGLKKTKMLIQKK